MDRDEVIGHLIEIKEAIAALQATEAARSTAQVAADKRIVQVEEDLKGLNKKVNFAHGMVALAAFVITTVVAAAKWIFK